MPLGPIVAGFGLTNGIDISTPRRRAGGPLLLASDRRGIRDNLSLSPRGVAFAILVSLFLGLAIGVFV